MVIKKIFAGVFDDEIHNNFLKYGRGEYKDKFLLEGKKQASKWSVKTGPEYANMLVRNCLLKVSGLVKIRGVIVATSDLSKELKLPFGKVSNFQGVRKHVLDGEVDPSLVLDAMDRFPRAFFALSFKSDDFDLKIKEKAPTSGKPGKDSDEGPKAEFCSLKTTDKSLVEELFFDDAKFSDVRVSHMIRVENIVYPKDVDKLSPNQVRELSKRQGTIFRKTVIDGKEKVIEAKFIA